MAVWRSSGRPARSGSWGAGSSAAPAQAAFSWVNVIKGPRHVKATCFIPQARAPQDAVLPSRGYFFVNAHSPWAPSSSAGPRRQNFRRGVPDRAVPQGCLHNPLVSQKYGFLLNFATPPHPASRHSGEGLSPSASPVHKGMRVQPGRGLPSEVCAAFKTPGRLPADPGENRNFIFVPAGCLYLRTPPLPGEKIPASVCVILSVGAANSVRPTSNNRMFA